jgi:hypothetical protein
VGGSYTTHRANYGSSNRGSPPAALAWAFVLQLRAEDGSAEGRSASLEDLRTEINTPPLCLSEDATQTV